MTEVQPAGLRASLPRVFQLIASVGTVLVIIAHFMVVLAAFRKGLLWGLAVLFIPVVTLVFIILNWKETRRAVILYLLGCLLIGFGGVRLRDAGYWKRGSPVTI